ncbi:MAG: hypothetical protein GX112_13170, partial [Clostridiaceae bacterium]|nr:hypothetical protein [Clostridiaceae bacterium]
IALTVSKAVPDIVFPSASAIVYGDNLSRSTLTGSSGDGSFAWLNPDTIPPVVNAGFPVLFTPHDRVNFMAVEQAVRIRVAKAAQRPLILTGIPDMIRYADDAFSLAVSGGSGTGNLRFAVTSGDAIAVDEASGEVTILKVGDAVVTVTKAGDSNFEAVSAAVRIDVKNAIVADDPEPTPTGVPAVSPSVTPVPTTTPTPTVSVTPAAAVTPSTVVTPEPSHDEPMQLPAAIREDTETGRFMVEIKVADLPAGTTSVQLSNGTRVDVSPNGETIQLEVDQHDLVDGVLELRALSAQKPLRSMKITVAADSEQSPDDDDDPGILSILMWLAAGLAIVGLAGLGIAAGKKARRSPNH